MIKPCGSKHPLTLQGLDRSMNTMDALHTSYALYDERRMQDHIVFWLHMAEKLNYFDGPNAAPQGNWKAQIHKDEAILLGEFASIKNEIIWAKWIEVLNSLIAGNTQQIMQRQWAYLFDLIFNTAHFIDRLYNALEQGSELKSWIEIRAAHMAPKFKSWIAYYKASVINPTPANNVFNYNYTLPELLLPWSKAEVLENENFSKLWFDSSFDSFNLYYQSIVADTSIFVGITQNPTTAKDFISLGAHYAGLVETGKSLLGYFGAVINKASEHFRESLEDNTHEPHIGLMLAFLHLTEPIKDELNGLVDRHYDYYLKEVLQSKPKEAQKDKVFVTAELTKPAVEALVQQGTLLNAGKDENGNAINYETDKTVVLNKATVGSIKSFCRTAQNLHTGIPNTFDGLEAELEKPEQGWSPFGTQNFPEAKIGVAISGDLFKLAEGDRAIEIKFVSKQNFAIASSDLFDNVSAFYTAEKGWEAFDKSSIELSVSGKVLKITLKALSTKPPIVEVDNKIHERDLYTGNPVLEIFFEGELAYKLRDVNLNSIESKVDVEGLKQVSLSNKLGNIDPSKAFLPFGPNPGEGAYVILGSSELFSKNISNAKLNINWKINQDYLNKTWANEKVKLTLLKENEWVDTDGTKKDELDFKGFLETESFTFKKGSLSESSAPQEFSVKSNSGFLKLTLMGSIGHESYQEDFLRASATIAKTPTTTTTLPEKPYTPEVEGLSVDYTSMVYALNLGKTSLEQTNEINFFHITPFGGNPAHGNDLNKSYPNMVWDSTNEGEFYIGFKDFKPGTSISCLINSIEGSSNPLKKAPKVAWSYLESNQWNPFESGDIIDNSNGLIQSGVLTVVIPLRFKGPGTLMGEKLFWVKASVLENKDAVCHVDTVIAQALEATLFSENIGQAHYREPLPSDTINKFVTPVSGIKKLSQPNVSFGGSPLEEPTEFRNRTSKRLRHKDRNVQMLDYEQLVLQEFPSLKKVRCLSHTKYEEDETTNDVHYSESAPGHVTVITLPKIVENIEPGIKRFTPISTLENIKTVVKQKASPFTTIHVKNPIYYEVELWFRVAFNEDILETEYYRSLLNESLVKFLSPFETGFRKTVFQSTIHKSEIVDFIDEQPYVHYLKDLVMDVYVDREKEENNKLNVETAVSDVQVALLVSAEKHTIHIIGG